MDDVRDAVARVISDNDGAFFHSKQDCFDDHDPDGKGYYLDLADKVIGALRTAASQTVDADLRDRAAKAALDAAAYSAEDVWADPARIPADSIEEDWTYALVTWEFANDHWRENGYRIADAVFAVIEREYRLVPRSVTRVTRRSPEESIDA